MIRPKRLSPTNHFTTPHKKANPPTTGEMVAETIVVPSRVGSMNADHTRRLSLLNHRSSTASILAQNVADARRRIASLSNREAALYAEAEEERLLSSPRHAEAAEAALRLAVARNSLARPNAAMLAAAAPSLGTAPRGGSLDLARAIAAASSPLSAARPADNISSTAELLLLRSLAPSASAQSAAAAVAAGPALRAQKEMLLRQLDLLDRAEAQATHDAILRARLGAALTSRGATAQLPNVAAAASTTSTPRSSTTTPSSPAASLKPPAAVPSSAAPRRETSTAAEVEQILASSAMRNNAAKQVLLEDHELREGTDVLCGRGGKSNHWQGNKRYRQVISDMRRKYRGIHTKTDKTSLSRAIVDYVNNYGGRFLKKDQASGKYFEMSKAEARKKTAQALRETKALKWTM
uniref:DUF6824 domain-containing protein n=1 Tax=Grammatophora oceanica TaxID=210454 RepID=A0A7S1YF18_9STRA